MYFKNTRKYILIKMIFIAKSSHCLQASQLKKQFNTLVCSIKQIHLGTILKK